MQSDHNCSIIESADVCVFNYWRSSDLDTLYIYGTVRAAISDLRGAPKAEADQFTSPDCVLTVAKAAPPIIPKSVYSGGSRAVGGCST